MLSPLDNSRSKNKCVLDEDWPVATAAPPPPSDGVVPSAAALTQRHDDGDELEVD